MGGARGDGNFGPPTPRYQYGRSARQSNRNQTRNLPVLGNSPEQVQADLGGAPGTLTAPPQGGVAQQTQTAVPPPNLPTDIGGIMNALGDENMRLQMVEQLAQKMPAPPQEILDQIVGSGNTNLNLSNGLVTGQVPGAEQAFTPPPPRFIPNAETPVQDQQLQMQQLAALLYNRGNGNG